MQPWLLLSKLRSFHDAVFSLGVLNRLIISRFLTRVVLHSKANPYFFLLYYSCFSMSIHARGHVVRRSKYSCTHRELFLGEVSFITVQILPKSEPKYGISVSDPFSIGKKSPWNPYLLASNVLRWDNVGNGAFFKCQSTLTTACHQFSGANRAGKRRIGRGEEKSYGRLSMQSANNEGSLK